MQFHIVDMQPDFLAVVNDALNCKIEEESIWLRVDGRSLSIAVRPGANGARGTSYACKEDPSVVFAQVSVHRFTLTLAPGAAPICLRSPKTFLLADVGAGAKINCVAVSAAHAVAVTGDSNGTVSSFSLDHENLRLVRRLKLTDAHMSDVTAVQIFPSGAVALSAGLDYTIKIWSLVDGSNPRTMRGAQKKRITAAALIGAHGRNFVSTSLDGSACVWECGTGRCIQVFRRIRDPRDPMLSVAVQNHRAVSAGVPESAGVPAATGGSGLFFECAGKRMFCGHGSGKVTVWDLGARAFVGEVAVAEGGGFTSLGGVSAIAVAGTQSIVVGFEKRAVVRCFDLAAGSSAERISSRLRWEVAVGDPGEEQEVKGLEILGDTVVCLSTDGFVSLNVSDGSAKEYLVGYDSVLNDFTISGGNIFACGKEGLLVEY